MIRKMDLQDLASVLEIESLCFQHPWNEKQVLYELNENPYAYVYVFIVDNEVIGFIDFWITFEQCQLAQIAIHPNHRGNGYGEKLMNIMITNAEEEMCESITLEVRSSNHKAQRLYKKFDFIEANIRKGYYHNGEDALVMIKPLGGNW